MAFTKVLPAGISSATNLVIDSINSAGVVTATGIVASTGTFSGNVSIGGTLTYEDVTNIDSVGIITAQSGIHVTGGSVGIGTDNPTKKLTVYGSDTELVRFTQAVDPGTQQEFGIGFAANLSHTHPAAQITYEEFDASDSRGNLLFYTRGDNSDSAPTERLRITSSGTVGVNTTAVDAQLEVHAAASKINAATIKTSAGAGGYAGLAFMAGQTTAGREKAAIYFQETNNGAHYTGDLVFALNSDSGSAVQVGTSDERLRITSSGNIGIGSDNPSRRLHVQSPGSTPSALFGNSENNNSIEVTRTGSTGSYFQVQTYTNICNIVGGPTLTFRTSDPVGSASTERLRITPSGDVGLKLTNNSTVKYGLTLAQGNTDPYKLGWADGGGTKRGAIWVNSSNDAMEFMTGSADAQRMRIRSDGRFELTTNGTYLSATSVDYYLNAGTSRTYGLYVHKNGTGTYGNYTYLLGGTSTQYAVGGQVDTNSAYSSGGGLFYSINSNTYGIVGYWSTAAYYTLYGNGVSLCTGGHTTSDARLKDVQSGIGTGILDKVCSLEAKKYTWKENTQQRRSVGDGTQIGLLAQDVLEHFPEVVMEHENPEIAGHNPETLNEQIGTTYSVDYGKLTAVLIEAIKELRSENNALAERITALEG